MEPVYGATVGGQAYTLDPEGVWTGPDPDIVKTANAQFNPLLYDRGGNPATLSEPHRLAARAMAERFGGTPVLPPHSSSPGMVY